MHVYVLRRTNIPDVDPFSQIEIFKSVLDICLNIDLGEHEQNVMEWDNDSIINSELVLNDVHGRPSIYIRKWPI